MSVRSLLMLTYMISLPIIIIILLAYRKGQSFTDFVAAVLRLWKEFKREYREEYGTREERKEKRRNAPEYVEETDWGTVAAHMMLGLWD